MTKNKPNFSDIENLWQLLAYLWNGVSYLLRYRTKELLLLALIVITGIYILQLRSCMWDGFKPVIEKEPLNVKNPFRGEERPQRKPPIPDVGK